MATNLTKADIAEALHDQVGVSRGEAARLVDQILVRVREALARDGIAKISGFGSFVVRDKNERIGRNPKDGVEYVIASRRVLTFRASEQLRAEVSGKASVAD